VALPGEVSVTVAKGAEETRAELPTARAVHASPDAAHL